MKKLLLSVAALLLTANVTFADGGDKKESEAKITREQAKEIALQQLPGGKIHDCDLEKRKGKLYWEVEVKSEDGKIKKEMKIDAGTGAVSDIKEDKHDD